MADMGAMFTDKRQEELEKRLRRIYSDAANDIEAKMQDFNRRYKVKEAKYRRMLRDGKITQEDFNGWMRGQVFQGKQWQAKKDQITETLYQSNQIAARMVRGEAVGVFAHNANFMSYQLEHAAGVNFGFGIYDSATVTRLVRDQPNLLPPSRVKRSKDKQWNSRKLTEQVTQGIIQGEPLDNIAKRMSQAVSVQDWKFMRTYAQTAMTGAQNAGRQLSLQNAKSMGIKVKKEWMATLDERTRTEHAELDGQRVDTNKPFKVGGYTIMYPGDPHAHPAMVYNCRCTLVGDLEDYPSEYERYDNIEGKPIKNMTYQKWYDAKRNAGDNNGQWTGRGHVDMLQKVNYTKSKLQWVIDDTGASEEDAKQMLSAVQTFTSHGYDWVVAHPDSEQYEVMYAGVEKYIDMAPKWNGGVIERGIRMNNSQAEQIKPGDVISQRGLASSWTTDSALARKAAISKLKSDETGVVFHLNNENMLRGSSVAHIAKNPREQEVILSGKTSTVVESVTEEWVSKKKRILHVYVKDGGSGDRR